MANSLAHRAPEPITNRFRFKLGKAKIDRLGESPYKADLHRMSFKQRDYNGGSCSDCWVHHFN